jgi:hypothetical protein
MDGLARVKPGDGFRQAQSIPQLYFNSLSVICNVAWVEAVHAKTHQLGPALTLPDSAPTARPISAAAIRHLEISMWCSGGFTILGFLQQLANDLRMRV